MNNKQKLLTATAITGTIVSASAFTVFDYAICRRKKQPDVRKKEKWKPYLDYVLKEQEWLKEHQEQELKEIRSKDGLTPVSYTHLDVYKRQPQTVPFS